jgi:uncharacterized protein (TIGR02145 family)
MKTKIFVLLFIVTIKVVVNAQKTIQIGSQIWMTENLKTKSFKNGDAIRQVFSDDQWEICNWNKIPAFKVDPNTNEYYYNYFAVNDSRGLAPNSFRIPMLYDFIQLAVFCGGKKEVFNYNDGTQNVWIEGISSKLRNSNWINPGINSFSFNIGRTGMIQYNGKIDHLQSAFLWSSDGHIAFVDENKSTDFTYEKYQDFGDKFPKNKASYKLFLKSIDKENMFIYEEKNPDPGYPVRCIKIN